MQNFSFGGALPPMPLQVCALAEDMELFLKSSTYHAKPIFDSICHI